MKNDYITRARKFIKQIYPYIQDDMKNVISVNEGVNAFNCDYNRKVVFDSGAVRCALITSDYVVKWDYSKHYAGLFGGCLDELRHYKQAVADGYGYLFAKITRVVVCGKVFYIMPKVKGIGSSKWTLSREEEYYLNNILMISDVHEQNYGTVKGKTVIVDYAATY